jgi:translocation and assembly module TamB
LAPLELELTGVATLDAGLPLDCEITWRWPAAAVTGSGSVRGTLAELALRQSLRVPQVVSATGQLRNLTGQPSVAVDFTWESVSRPVTGLGELQLSSGAATLSGRLDDWQLSARSAAGASAWPGLAGSRFEGTARGDRQQANLGSFTLATPAGRIDGTGTLQFAAEPRLQLEIGLRDLQTQRLQAGLDGRVDGTVSLRVAADGSGEASIRQLAGQLLGRQLRGRGQLAWRDGQWRFDQVDLAAGRNRLEIDGSVGTTLSGRARLDAPELARLWPGLEGTLSARAELAGTRAAPVVALEAQARRLRWDGYRLDALRFDGSVDRRQRARMDLSATGLATPAVALGDLEARLSGTLADHQLDAELRGGALKAALSSTGSYINGTLRHRLLAADLQEPRIGPWKLDGQPAISLAVGRATVGAHCWKQSPATLCVDTLDWSPAKTRLQARLAEFGLERLSAWLPPELALAGRATVDLDLGWAGGALDGTAAASLDGAAVRYTADGEDFVTPLQLVQAAARFDAGSATATLELAGAEGLRLALDGRMLAPLSMQAPVQVTVAGALPDVAPFLPFLAPDLDLSEVGGEVTVDAAVAGTFAEPELTGVARLTGGSVALPAFGVKLEGIDISLLGDGSPVLRLQGSARAGGRLSLAGEASPLDEGGPTAWFRVVGNRVDAINLPDLQVKASPDVTVRYAAGRFTAGGRVAIPQASVVVRELPETAVLVSPDVVVLDRATAPVETRSSTLLGGEIELLLGDKVRLQGFGLDTRLEGSVKIAARAGDELAGFGVLRLKDGKFGAYGRELTIEQGTLGFSGPLDDPALNLRATRRVEWQGRIVKSGLLIEGTASRAESRVFSEPAMAEADALSYLISGRPLQAASDNERSAVAGAALALGVQQAAPLTRRIGSAVTLDELTVAGSSLEESELVAGKQVSDDLYLRFTYGLFNRIGTVLARYRLNRNLSVEAASGEEQSLDLVYSIERD